MTGKAGARKGLSVAVSALLWAMAMAPAAAHSPQPLIGFEGHSVPLRGAPVDEAKVLIVEFSDFQCPYCGRAADTIGELLAAYPDTLAVAYMHNPLAFHQDARNAAKASVAAHLQGAFWPLHDAMFDNMRALGKDKLERYARRAGIQTRKFVKDMGRGDVERFVARSQAISIAAGSRGTPGFFVNGHLLKGAQPLAKFQELVDQEIAAADRAGQRGAKWLQDRTRSHHGDLAAYLFDGKKPPAEPAAAARKPRPVDTTVYRVTVDRDMDPMLGKPDALVTLVVFSEFQCPFCARLQPTLEKIRKTYPDQVRIVFKHNPLPFHKEALPAAIAAECARRQGKFWKMHDLLFAHQKELGTRDIRRHARTARLNIGAFAACIDSASAADRVKADQELAATVTARGTPNTFVNGRKVTGAQPFDGFRVVIDEQLKEARKLVESGVPTDRIYDHVVGSGTVHHALGSKTEVKRIPVGQSAMRGSSGATVQLVVFGDYQCPYCARAAPALDKVLDHYGARASLVYKHFPLSFHKQARSAAVAALCAKDQGRFWEMHDQLYADQGHLADEMWAVYADRIGLDVRAFSRCMDSGTHEDQINQEMNEGRAINVRGTPSIFINGRPFESPAGYTFPAMREAIDRYILR